MWVGLIGIILPSVPKTGDINNVIFCASMYFNLKSLVMYEFLFVVVRGVDTVGVGWIDCRGLGVDPARGSTSEIFLESLCRNTGICGLGSCVSVFCDIETFENTIISKMHTINAFVFIFNSPLC